MFHVELSELNAHVSATMISDTSLSLEHEYKSQDEKPTDVTFVGRFRVNSNQKIRL